MTDNRALLEVVEDFNDRLAEAASLENACGLALPFMLAAIGRPTGVLLVQTPQEAGPLLDVRCSLPASWASQLEDPASVLRQLACGMLLDGAPAHQNLQPDLAAAIPLLAKPGPQGVLFVCGAPCSSTEIETLAHLAHAAGRIIVSWRSKQIPVRHAQELEALQAISTALSFNLEVEEVQTQIIQGVCHSLGAELGSLVLLDEEQGELITKKTLVGNARWVYQVSSRGSPGVIQECLRSGQPVRIADASNDPRVNPDFDALEGHSVSSLICAPLAVRTQILGALLVANKQHGTFDANDQDLLLMVAGLTSQAIYGTRLIQQLKVANADLEASHWELLRSRNTLRALFDSMPAALYIVDRKHRLIAINLSCAHRAEQAPQALVGRQCYEALYGRNEPCPGCKVSETLFGGQHTNRTERRWDTTEDSTEWEISTYPILDETEQVVQAILLEQDVTEKRRLEGIIAQSEKLAAVGQLAAGVAHEINNPLTAVIANAQLLQRQLPADVEMQESIDLITRAGERAAQVVRNLLDFARKEQYQLAPTDVNATIRRALALAQHELLARSIHLSFEPASDLPLILASQDHLQGVWLNLLMNAMDSIEQAPGTIRIVTRRVGNEIRASVADNGAGIPPERLSRIFEPFYTTKAPGRGTGLGLSVCHRIVKQHGGHIQVDSQINQGTELTVVLPVS